MNKRIKKKAKQAAIREALHRAYIEALARVFMPLWNQYKLIDTPLLKAADLPLSDGKFYYEFPYGTK